MDEMLRLAHSVIQHAYAPHSGFPVAVTLKTRDSHLYTGVNVENSAYPLARCAEQIAVGAMVTGGGREITEVLILSTGEEPATPCGACRQILAEFSGPSTTIRCVSTKGIERRYTLGELLPHEFHLSPSTAV